MRNFKSAAVLRDLLERYISHVGSCEGVTYINSGHINTDDEQSFTEEEWVFLRKLDRRKDPRIYP
jgi:hypothetical protein